MDAATGNRSVFSSATVGAGPVPVQYNGLELDIARNRVLVFDRWAVYAVDLATGNRSLVSNESFDPPDISRGFSSLTAGQNGVSHLLDEFNNAIVRLDLFSGVRESISSSGLTNSSPLISHPVVGGGLRLEYPGDVAFDEAANRVFVAENDTYADPLIEIDLATGDRLRVLDSGMGTGTTFRRPTGVAVASALLAYASDSVADTLSEVDLATGNRRVLAGDPSGRGTINQDLTGVALSNDAQFAFVIDYIRDSLFSVNLASGVLQTVSDVNTGAGPLLNNPVDLQVEGQGAIIYVAQRGSGGAGTLLAVDSVTGNRRVVSSSTVGRGASLVAPVGLALHKGQGLLDVADDSQNAIIQVALDSGNRSVFSSSAVGRLALQLTAGYRYRWLRRARSGA